MRRERVPVPGGHLGARGRAAEPQPGRKFASAPSLSARDATGQHVGAASGAGGQQAGEEPRAALQTRETRARQRGAGGRSQACESQPERARHNRFAVSQVASCCLGGQTRSHTLFSSFYQPNREQSKWFVGLGFFFPQCGSWWWCAVALCEG